MEIIQLITIVNSKPTRIDKELDDVFKKLSAERLLRGIDPNFEPPRRMSKVIARRINIDKALQEELIGYKLEDDRKFRRKRK